MNLAVIPARGASKRIPKKNIREFCGKPMIAYAIDVAKRSGLFDHVIVSTDDQEIRHISQQYGAETPFTRPDNLADDHTPTVPVMVHAISTVQDLGLFPDHVCCIYPSVPLLQVCDLKNAFALHLKHPEKYVFPVSKFSASVQRALKMDKQGNVSPFFPENVNRRTQDTEIGYHDAGQFYWASAKVWLSKLQPHEHALGYCIPSWRSVDIDTPEDWQRAEIIFRYMEHEEVR